MAAGFVSPEPVPKAPAQQSEEDRAFWFGLLPKPRQEVDCACAKDGPPLPCCVDCLGTGKHARRTTQANPPQERPSGVGEDVTKPKKKSPALYECTTPDCESEPFPLGWGAARDKQGRPWCVACYAWRRRWISKWMKENPTATVEPEPPMRTKAERPVPPGAEKRRVISAYVLPELDELLTKRQQKLGFLERHDFIVYVLANLVGREDLGPRKPRKARKPKATPVEQEVTA